MNPLDRNIIDANEADFEFEVIAYSQQTPVIVDFWATWCAPCRVLGPLLEKLAIEGQGRFRLAKVNVDENPNLSRRFNVRSIPSVKAFQNGRMVAEFSGALPEPQLRAFLTRIVPDETTLALEKGFSLLNDREPGAAEETFRQIIEEKPGDPAALLGLVKSLLWQGESHESGRILAAFPSSPQYLAAQSLRPLADALERTRGAVDYDLEHPLEAAYRRALALLRRGNLPAALDGLLDILREDKRYRSGEVHKVILALFELVGEQHPLTVQYRRELAMVLF